MRARVVIGANYGDEGKGLVTDYLCAKDGGTVVRFNGGAQAGHTVVTPDGRRHVFGHVGSGAFLGMPTFLSQFFICNPIVFFNELGELDDQFGIRPAVHAHPDCLITTFADMIINQRLEDARADSRHGSTGLGINETVERSQIDHLRITMADLWNGVDLEPRLHELCTRYAEFRTGRPIIKPDSMIEGFKLACRAFAQRVHPAGIAQCKDPIFEGAQGLLLDQNNAENFPHVTRSNTGMQNVRVLCDQAGIDQIETYYVSRTYLTRHGAGPLPGEDPDLHYDDQTNVEHKYQGRLRFAPLDYCEMVNRCWKDNDGSPFKLVLTHCDQEPARGMSGDLYAYGPTREDVST